MYYWNPQRLKELKARGHRLQASPASLVKKSDQGISRKDSTEARRRAPGPGLKHQAPSKPKPEPSSGSEVPSNKLQAPSNKLQA